MVAWQIIFSKLQRTQESRSDILLRTKKLDQRSRADGPELQEEQQTSILSKAYEAGSIRCDQLPLNKIEYNFMI